MISVVKNSCFSAQAQNISLSLKELIGQELPIHSDSVMIRIESGNIRLRFDGAEATTVLGILYAKDDLIVFENAAVILPLIKIIKIGGSAPDLSIHFYEKEGE